MVVGTLEMSLRLPECHSLKEKRHLLRGCIERTRRAFGVSIAEVADHDMWGNAVIGVAYVSANSVQAESILNRVLEIFDAIPEIEVHGYDLDVTRTS